MPRRIPWRQVLPVEPTTTYVVHAGTFVVDRWRSLPRFLRETARVRRRLRGADGLIGFAFMARFSGRTFTAVTAWENRGRLGGFIATPEHSHAAGTTRRHLGTGSKLVSWESYGSDLPPRPDRVSRELEAVPGLGGLDGSTGHLVGAGGAHHPA